jgi:hypothetical protein
MALVRKVAQSRVDNRGAAEQSLKVSALLYAPRLSMCVLNERDV